MKMFLIFLLSLLLTTCDTYVLSSPSYVPSSDAGFISLVGERLEKYYWKMDPSSLNNSVDLISPQVLGSYTQYSDDLWGNYVWTSGYNQLTLYGVPIKCIFEPLYFPSLNYSGTIAARRESFMGLSGSFSYSNALLTSPSPSLYLNNTDCPLNYNQTHEQYTVPVSFESNILSLPRTAYYANSQTETKFKIYYVPISEDIFSTFPYSTSVGGGWSFLGVYPTEVICAAETWEPYILSSRNFFQYKYITITYEPNTPLSNFTPFPIIDTWYYDPYDNALTFIFNDYDDPYIGDVFSFSIQVENGSILKKTVSIRN